MQKEGLVDRTDSVGCRLTTPYRSLNGLVAPTLNSPAHPELGNARRSSDKGIRAPCMDTAGVFKL